MSASHVSAVNFPLTPPMQPGSTQQPIMMSVQLPQTPQSPSQTAVPNNDKPTPNQSSQNHADNLLPTPANSISGSLMTSAENKSQDISMEDVTSKRKRELSESDDRSQKRVHIEDRRLGIEDLHLDVGEKYLLCRTPHPTVKPDLSQDLFDMYSLSDIAAKVARTLPSGEKKSMRKTYKGKIKDLGISGKFDVSVRGEEEEGGLFAMMCIPEQEWAVAQTMGKEIEKGLSAETRGSLAKAMTMSKGVIPKTQWDSAVLGELDFVEKKTSAAPLPPKTSATVGNPPPRLPSSMREVQRSVSTSELNRPKRKVKQRSYEDTSYEGYGEGYVDDEMIDAGYSSGDGDDRGSSQKRRKKNASSHNFSGPIRHGSYGPGMVGA